MSEKEERILIRKINENPCTKCVNAHYVTCQSCSSKKDYKLSIPRAKAIEKMAKAMSANDMPVAGYKVLAEAALDSLLEV